MLDLSRISQANIAEGAAEASAGSCDSDLLRRALAAYYRGGGREQALLEPIVVNHLGKLFIAVSSRRELLAIYRIRNDLQLKRLRRVPLAVAAFAEFERQGRGMRE